MIPSAAVEHSARMRNHLAAEISAGGGWLSFERFMDLALYAPGLGYYSGGAQKLGEGGDFTTAPEVSRLFGACVAVQCAEVLRNLSAGSVLEIGAGSGRLAADLLARLETLGQLPDNYWILEVSADLRQRQREYLEKRLPHSFQRVHWLDRPPAESFDGVILANEVLDALPVARFRWRESGVEELGVEIRDRKFAWAARPANAAMLHDCRELAEVSGPWDDGYVSEYCPRLGAWTRAVTAEDAARCGLVVRLWTTAYAVLFARAARRHLGVPLPASPQRGSVCEHRIAGHQRLGGLYARGRGVQRRRL